MSCLKQTITSAAGECSCIMVDFFLVGLGGEGVEGV